MDTIEAAANQAAGTVGITPLIDARSRVRAATADDVAAIERAEDPGPLVRVRVGLTPFTQDAASLATLFISILAALVAVMALLATVFIALRPDPSETPVGLVVAEVALIALVLFGAVFAFRHTVRTRDTAREAARWFYLLDRRIGQLETTASVVNDGVFAPHFAPHAELHGPINLSLFGPKAREDDSPQAR